MKPARSRSRSAIFIWVAICLAVGLVGTVVVAVAKGHDDTLLTVDGWTLTRAQFVDELQQIAANKPYLAARSSNGQTLKVFKDGSTTDFEDAFVVEFLNERVTFALAEAEVARRSLTVTSDDRDRAIKVIEGNLAAGTSTASTSGTTPPTSSAISASVLDNFGSYRNTLIDGVANLQALQRDLTKGSDNDAKLRALYDQVKGEYALQSCVRHILVNAGTVKGDASGNPVTPTDDEYAAALQRANDLKAQLDGGTDFATLASQVSDDPRTKPKGGDLGCAPKGQYDTAFDDAAWNQPVGVVGPPVKSVYGYHIILVTDRRERTFDEINDKLQEVLDTQVQQALQDWVTSAAKSATVTVASGVGTWNASTGVIEPPGGASLGLSPGQGTGDTAPPATAGVPLAGG